MNRESGIGETTLPYTDHKVIGIQYLVTTFVYCIGGVLDSAELKTPVDFVSREVYNSCLLHGTIMIFCGLSLRVSDANYLIPLMIGRGTWPRLNVRLWIIPPAGLMLIGSLLIDAPDAGWTSSPQLGNRSSRSVSLDFQPAVAWHILDWIFSSSPS